MILLKCSMLVPMRTWLTLPVLLQRTYLHRLAKFLLCWNVAPRCNTLMQQQ